MAKLNKNEISKWIKDNVDNITFNYGVVSATDELIESHVTETTLSEYKEKAIPIMIQRLEKQCNLKKELYCEPTVSIDNIVEEYNYTMLEFYIKSLQIPDDTILYLFDYNQYKIRYIYFANSQLFDFAEHNDKITGMKHWENRKYKTVI